MKRYERIELEGRVRLLFRFLYQPKEIQAKLTKTKENK